MEFSIPASLPSLMPANRSVLKHSGSNQLQKSLTRMCLMQRNHIVISLVLSVKIRSTLNFSHANFPSSIKCEKLFRTSKQIHTARVQLLAFFWRQMKPIYLAYLKRPTCVLHKNVTIMPKDILPAQLRCGNCI